MIGKGGSSRVYRVMNGANEIYAIKRVSLDKSDKETMEGYINEMQFLKRLEGNTRIIRLIDSEIKPANNAGKGTLFLVMECGEIDLARLLVEQQKKPMDIVWIAYYWKQMLEAVHVIHEEKIIHSDLKPANFVLVKGQLKLIDFGIARAIANDTTNIQRDHQIGTVNYMSPEAIEVQDGNTRIKVGRASDVWSLGCILYQMVYGRPPFHHITKVFNKMRAIPDPTHIIDFPEHSVTEVTVLRPPKDKDDPPIEEIEEVHTRVPSSVIRVLQSCLSRNHKERMTIPQLLQEEWLAMVAPEPEIREIPRQLQPDEAIINMFHMMQLLEHTLKLGRKKPKWSEQELRDHAMFLIEQLRGVTSPP
ncbi:Pkinase-domain-containing protein [Wolfiporia cocos MD-104 SS10]|uniref:Pkinase-domain-containing protein n=1 Tax=Wolfiporia cocos (strain MD-104) TaxID=742152 RepID=A0A2H3JJV8_WOLCO|nr:Pkinase-domain-containing protein [Wolfiporia cocos MD-104 SS10]